MHNLTNHFTKTYNPVKGIVIYADPETNEKYYTESFDFNASGKMINAHPLTTQESRELGEILLQDEEENEQCFQSAGLMPANVVYLKPGKDGFVVWHTPAQKRNLFFVPELGLADGVYPVPPLLWIADRTRLRLLALKTNERLTPETRLFNAPFFNIYSSGLVCMGTVDIEIDAHYSLEELIKAWQEYFFNSKFSHLLIDRSPVKSNIIQLFKKLSGSTKQFPQSELLKTGKKLKQMLHGID